MSQAPPPYPGTEKAGQPNPAYPPPQGYGVPPQPYQPMPAGQPGYAQQPQYGQPANYQAPPPQGPTTVVLNQPAYTVVQHYRETPIRTKCQYCQADVVTSTFYETGTLTWVACFIIAIVGCWLGCCLIPFCMDACGYPVPCYPAADVSHIHLQGNTGQQGYGPQPGAPTTVVVQQPQTVVVQQFRETPVHTRCPHCQAEVVTSTMFETGTFAWIICVVLCVIGCDLGCCLIPFCVDGCKDVVHSCPNCHQMISRWSRM